MQIGVVLPQTELGATADSLRTFALGVESLGYDHVLAYDHVLGADPSVHTDWNGPYDIDTQFHEPFVLFGFIAGCTGLACVSGIIILPQRQTALVAKQATEVDLLTGGRFRLGIGIGWNRVEYDALGEDFSTRGRRVEEQVGLLRQLWTSRSVTSEGEFDVVIGAGLAPMPIQQPIPVWFGATTPPAFRRAGRLGDGWFPHAQPGPRLDAALEDVHAGAREANRDPSEIGMQGRVDWRGDEDNVTSQIEKWRTAGATHVGVNTMGAGLTTVDEHLDALGRVASKVM